MSRGYLSIILHAHLPYVRHPEHERFLEENWYFEALTETYLPILNNCHRLLKEEIPFRLTVSLSPTLVSMFRDPLLTARYNEHLDRLRELARMEVKRTRGDKQFHPLALMYQRLIDETIRSFRDDYGEDLVKAFRALQDAGVLELMTCTATHGFLPLLRSEPSSVRAQVLTGAANHERLFGSPARGIWLPECGYYPGLEDVLQEAGFRFFIVETHGILHADVRPRYGVMAPIACANGVAAFGRDPESSRQVWSATDGYPGDHDYRDFYRDIGFDRELEYIAPYILDGKIRIHTGFKYYRVTGRTETKEPYDPERARGKVALHASHFLGQKEEQIARAAHAMDRPPIVVAPFDAELFGHWWFEGPMWLDYLVRKTHSHGQHVVLATPSDYLERHPSLQQATPSASSWGFKGFNECWVSGENDWVYPQVHSISRRIHELVRLFEGKDADPLTHRALKQAARTALLIQASDWPFIMKTGTSGEYAKKQVCDHVARFNFIEQSLRTKSIDERKLGALETLDNIFPDIDYRVFK